MFYLITKKAPECCNKNTCDKQISTLKKQPMRKLHCVVVNVVHAWISWKHQVTDKNISNNRHTKSSVDGENVTLDLVAQLGLEVTQLLLEHCQRRHDNGLRSQGATRLHVVIEPARTHTHTRIKGLFHICFPHVCQIQTASNMLW